MRTTSIYKIFIKDIQVPQAIDIDDLKVKVRGFFEYERFQLALENHTPIEYRNVA